MNQQHQAYQAKLDGMRDWMAAQKIEVDAGRQLRSQAFAGYYDRAMATPSGPLDVPIMDYSARMVKAARALESGQITKDQYDDQNREQLTILNQRVQEIQHQASIEDQNRRQAAAAMYLQMRPRTTNCYSVGTYAGCTTY